MWASSWCTSMSCAKTRFHNEEVTEGSNTKTLPTMLSDELLGHVNHQELLPMPRVRSRPPVMTRKIEKCINLGQCLLIKFNAHCASVRSLGLRKRSTACLILLILCFSSMCVFEVRPFVCASGRGCDLGNVVACLSAAEERSTTRGERRR